MPDKREAADRTAANHSNEAAHQSPLSNQIANDFVFVQWMAQLNAISNQDLLNKLGLSVLAKASRVVTDLGPVEAASIAALFCRRRWCCCPEAVFATVKEKAGN